MSLVWLHLGGSYCGAPASTRSPSWSGPYTYRLYAMVYIARLQRRWWVATFIAVLVVVFFYFLVDSSAWENTVPPRRIEEDAPRWRWQRFQHELLKYQAKSLNS
jgi:hypothetical protein